MKAHAAPLPALKRYEDKVGGVILGGFIWRNVVFSRKPIRTAADFKGLKIRVFGAAQTEFIRALGAEAVAIPFAKVYTALDRGTVDAALTGTYSYTRSLQHGAGASPRFSAQRVTNPHSPSSTARFRDSTITAIHRAPPSTGLEWFGRMSCSKLWMMV